ncbi:MAG: hypothetical protein PWP16_1271 [Eubacteriaceae bacterium]|jgi:uncharacterized membrane protein YeaQ/YmgE (transglycosylase-associated protein family)|nr:hypothetical protein [Eubacteriaceae bacterium]MDK2937327.1 hypothetical protein [Eubacteriaceae bacterium]MDN5307908.1 hypothetical protein [Eubacteriaceae bacterium]
MGIFTWIILGAISGWLASIITSNNKKMGLVKNVLIGILGAIIGGWIFSYFGQAGVTGLNLWSIFVSFVGAAILLVVINLIKD